MARDPVPILAPNQFFAGDITMMPTASLNATSVTPKGRNTSNRPWKLRPQKRASSLVTCNAANAQSKSWAQKQVVRLALKASKEREIELKEQSRQAALQKKERRLDNERRRAENEYKAMSSQKLNLKNVDRKLKAMNKKQLRMIKKTRINNRTGVVELVSAYAK